MASLGTPTGISVWTALGGGFQLGGEYACWQVSALVNIRYIMRLNATIEFYPAIPPTHATPPSLPQPQKMNPAHRESSTLSVR